MVDRLADFTAECRRRVTGELRDDLTTRVLYSTDASLYQLMPLAVLIPRTTEDVIAAVALAAAYGLPVLPRAAGTSLAGQAVNEALVIDFSRHLDAILAIDPAARTARVQPGVVLDDLDVALRPFGLQFGPDPASSNRSTIGGAVANNATGSHSLLYGMTADHVRGMQVVLSDGESATLSAATRQGRGSAELRIANRIDQLVADPSHRRTIRDGTPRYWRRCGGYNLDRLLGDGPPDLAQLVCGSEGTLAVMTEITIGLVPRPAHTGLALVEFDGLSTALAAVPDILDTGPSAVELLDNLSLALCRDVPAYARLLASVITGQPHCLLVVEYQGESAAAVQAAVERLAARLERDSLGATGLTPALTPAAQAAVWRVRKVSLGLLMSLRGDVKPVPFIEDAAVPVEHLGDYVRQIEQYCAGLGTPITYYAHAGAGCLHIRPLINRRRAAEIAKLPDIARFAAGLVKGYGGALSSEHGDGRTSSWLNESFHGPALYDLFRQVKRAFDPDNRLNPGIIVDAGPMTVGLRPVAHDDSTPHLSFKEYEGNDDELFRIVNLTSPNTLPTNPILLPTSNPSSPSNNPHDSSLFNVPILQPPTTANNSYNLSPQPPPAPDPVPPPSDQSADNDLITPSGFARAVEMCNGAGICRQRSSGTMCPSFMVTRDEEHSTRGRANALRAALSGVLPVAELTSPRLYAVMDLCIGCKACKAECPSAVDLARLKIEFLARYQAVHGVSRRARFFGHAATLNRLGSGAAAPLANAVMRSAAGRRVMDRLFGLAPERPLPPLARQSFAAWWRARRPPVIDGVKGEIALLIDPFTNYNEPRVGMAAVAFFEAVGVRVVAAPAVDDGRPLLSKGLVSEARRAAERATRALWPLVERGLPIVGLEPSTLLTLRDEYLYLLPDDPRVAAVAARALTFEEYVAALAERHDLRPYFTPAERRVLLHGHCHQKALVGSGPARRALALPPGYTVEEVDSGCCGMAGSFGYEAEHYAISLQMAERRLLPAVRAAGAATIIAAAGVSCRQQIAQGSGRVALHPAEVLANALVP